jgi:hypothetical protein
MNKKALITLILPQRRDTPICSYFATGQAEQAGITGQDGSYKAELNPIIKVN